MVALSLVFVAGCSSQSKNREPETVAVTVTVALSASEVGAATLDYHVSHPNTTILPAPLQGTVAVTDPTTSFTLTQLPVVAANDPYTLFLVARRGDGSWVCEGGTPFHIEDGKTMMVPAVLTCPTSDPTFTGNIGVDVTFDLNFCPRIEGITADPMLTEMSMPVTLSGVAMDPDATALVTYTWTSPGGTITQATTAVDGTSATATFTCMVLGDQEVTLTVSDSDNRCDQRLRLLIGCTPDHNCGNGVKELTQFCDDGENDGGEGECLNCTTIQLCGDGTANGTEECDDRGQSVDCDTDCTFTACQDGTLNISAGEVCDDGMETASCDTDCTPAICGDGVVNATAGETCDTSGPSPTCTAECLGTTCGDSVINVAAGEQCDDGGDSATCDDDCTPAVCGDGKVNLLAGELCDDAGESPSCNVDCTPSVCPDGKLNTTSGEVCDDGVANGSGPGLCEPGCTAPRSCGNGSIETGEECDESTATANCDANCTLATCGDGTFNAAAGEQCDGGGETGACDTDCTNAICQDGMHNPTAGEQCDDGAETAICDVD